MATSDLRTKGGLALAGLLGVVFVGIGLFLQSAPAASAAGSGAGWRHLFGVRELFLGGFTLLLLAMRERRALFGFLASTIVLPVADMVATAPDVGLARAALANLPYELPLVLVVFLLWPAARERPTAP